MFTVTKGRSYITDQVRNAQENNSHKMFASALPLCARPWTKTSGHQRGLGLAQELGNSQ